MPVAVGPYGQSQPSCFDRVKMGFVMGCAVGMAAGALFGTFSCLSNLPRATTTYGSLSNNRDKWKEMPDFRNTEFTIKRIGMRGRELMGGIGKTMMQSGGTFGTFMAIGMGIRC